MMRPRHVAGATNQVMTAPENHTTAHAEKPARVLALQGGPRQGGNTDRLLDEVLNAVRERGVSVEKVVIRDLKVSPCLEITQCMQTGHCAIRDDMTGLYDRLTTASVVIAASPIFFYGPSAHLKAVIDRCQALWSRKYILKRTGRTLPGRGYVVSAAATGGRKLFDGFLMTARYFFDVLDLEWGGELLVRGVDEAGDVDRHPTALADARSLGEEIARFVPGTP